MKQKTITICNKEVQMIYCAATENVFEEISSKEIGIFIPKIEKDEEGKSKVSIEAKVSDWLRLAIASIVAAYTRHKQEPPVTFDDVVYDASPTERNEMISTIIELRNEWYDIPKIAAEIAEKDRAEQPKEDAEKN